MKSCLLVLTLLFPIPVLCQVNGPRTTTIRFYSGVNQASVAKLMDVVDKEISGGTRRIVLLISSSGGSVAAGLSAYNYLKGVPIEIITHNFGTVASMALVLYCAGSKRYSVPQGRFLLHGAVANFAEGTQLDDAQLDARLKSLRQQHNSIAAVIASTIKKPIEEVQAAMLARTVLTVEEALKWGIVHEVREQLYEDGARVLSIADSSTEENIPQASQVSLFQIWD